MSGNHSNLSGNQRRKMRSASRLYAVQALFQMEHSSQSIDLVRVEFLNFRFGETYEGAQMLDGDVDHFTQVLEGAVKDQADIDQQTDRALVANGRWAASTQHCAHCSAPLGVSCVIHLYHQRSRSKNTST